MGTELTGEQFNELFAAFEHTAFRLELQPAYAEPSEHATLARFLNGDPQPPTEVEGLQNWFAEVRKLREQGKRIERVRVHEDPPTDYQRWERWIGKWNTEAGETIGYLTRDKATEIGLLPDAGDIDWWLFDSSRLVTMHFDQQGNRIRNELITDAKLVVQACAWRDLAVHYSAPLNNGVLLP